MIGWMATTMAIIMFVSYIDQIRLNLSGQKGSVIQPAATIVNCIFWTAYGFLKEKCDWPIIVANIPGIVLGIVALITAL
jgi:uncharacterized protein with PQ loop repeat